MSNGSDAVVITPEGLAQLIRRLGGEGYTVVGPTLRNQAIVYDEIDGVDDLPAGWTDEQAGGHYRLHRREDDALFGYAVGPQSWKQYLHPPVFQLWRAERSGDGMRVTSGGNEPPPRYAFLGVRSCELNAIAVQDRVFLGGPYVDPHYQARRENTFIVAVNCGVAGNTCFCVSMNTGPGMTSGYDLSLTEIIDADGHRFLLEVGSDMGARMATQLPNRAAQASDLAAAQAIVERTVDNMGRAMPDTGLPALLKRNLEHPRWDDVAERCLSCTNCTMVCPTCFCTSVTDENDLLGESATRTRHWDSCFNLEFSYIHGGSVRRSTKSRYRQWMTHKLATWWDQFGTSGCVGCGRCITFCPVGIDITEEARAIYNDDRGGETS